MCYRVSYIYLYIPWYLEIRATRSTSIQCYESVTVANIELRVLNRPPFFHLTLSRRLAHCPSLGNLTRRFISHFPYELFGF